MLMMKIMTLWVKLERTRYVTNLSPSISPTFLPLWIFSPASHLWYFHRHLLKSVIHPSIRRFLTRFHPLSMSSLTSFPHVCLTHFLFSIPSFPVTHPTPSSNIPNNSSSSPFDSSVLFIFLSFSLSFLNAISSINWLPTWASTSREADEAMGKKRKRGIEKEVKRKREEEGLLFSP